MDAITVAHDGDIQMIDSTSVRVHQQAATARASTDGGSTTEMAFVAACFIAA